ncbi:MAG: hypothetical protein Q9190_006745 [Brigantiaea leucoxantha]
MAAQSRLSLRPSSRRSAGQEELSPTVIPLSINTRKRTRDISIIDTHKLPQKLPKIHPTTAKTRSNVLDKIDAAKCDAAPSTTDALTQVDVDSRNLPLPSVQRQPNGSVTTLEHDGPESDPQSAPAQKLQVKPKTDKRSLRSHSGGLRSKSELASYFPYYEEFMSNEPDEPDFLDVDTLVYIIDEPSQSASSSLSIPKHGRTKHHSLSESSNADHKGFPEANGAVSDTVSTFNNAEVLDFSSTERHAKLIPGDPLNDELYFKAHRRAERSEKQLRNIEKERAQHEKVQLDRLYDGLKGPDWLKVMGISGVTEMERKAYESKRDHFIYEVGALLKKFRAWKEEEKRRKFDRERASTVDDEETNGEEDEDDDGEEEEE